MYASRMWRPLICTESGRRAMKHVIQSDCTLVRKFRKLALGLACAAIMGCSMGTAANAVTITFNGAHPGDTSVTALAFKLSPTRIVTGNCQANPCLGLINTQQTSLTYFANRLFTLQDFWFKLLGTASSNSLFVDTFGVGGVHLHKYIFSRQNVTPNQAYLFSALVNTPQINLTKVTFSSVNGGNIRIDNIVAKAISPIPIPTSLPLLVSAIGFMSLVRRRRASISV